MLIVGKTFDTEDDVVESTTKSQETDSNMLTNISSTLDINDYIMEVRKTLVGLNSKYDYDSQSSIDKYSYEVIQYIKAVRGIYVRLEQNEDRRNIDNILLAAFLATFLFKNNNMIYYKNNGITFEKCLEVLGLSKDSLLDFSGINYENYNIPSILSNLKTMININLRNNITINDISTMVIDREKTENYSIEELICKINPLITINGNFKKQVNEYIKDWNMKYQNDKMCEIFGDLTKESKDFIMQASMIYFGIDNKYDNEERAKLSILLAAINCTGYIDKKYKSFLEELVYEIKGVRNTNVHPQDKGLDIKYIEKHYKGIVHSIIGRKITPEDIIKNLYGEEENFEKAYNDFENEQIRTTLNRIQDYKAGEYIKASYKVMKCLDKAFKEEEFPEKFPYAKTPFYFSLFVGLYFCDNLYRKNFEEIGLDYETICKIFKLDSNVLIDEYNKVNYQSDLINYYRDTIKKHKKDISVEDVFTSHCGIIDQIMREFDIYSEGFNKIKDEVKNQQELRSFSEIPIELLNIKNANSIAKYGSSLEPLVKAINEATSLLSDKPINSEQVETIRDGLNEMTRKRNFIEMIFKGNTQSINLDVLDNLTKFLNDQIYKFTIEIKKFTHVKRLIAIYIYKVEQLIKVLQDELEGFNNKKDDNNTSPTYLIEQQEKELKKQLIEVKINDFNTAIIVMMDNYKKMCLLETTHAAYISNMNTSRTTVVPSLYTNLSVSNGLINQRNVSEAVGFINQMLTNMSSLNTEGLIKSLENINSNAQLVNCLPEDLQTEIARLTSGDKPKIKTIQ